MINKTIKYIGEVGLVVVGGVNKYGWYCIMILSGVGMLNIGRSIGVELLMLASIIIVLGIMRRMISGVLVLLFVEKSIAMLSRIIRVLKAGIGLLEMKVSRKEMGRVTSVVTYALISMLPISTMSIVKTIAAGAVAGSVGVFTPILAMLGGAAASGLGIAWVKGLIGSSMTASETGALGALGALGAYSLAAKIGSIGFGIALSWWGAKSLYNYWKGPGEPGGPGGGATGPTGGANMPINTDTDGEELSKLVKDVIAGNEALRKQCKEAIGENKVLGEKIEEVIGENNDLKKVIKELKELEEHAVGAVHQLRETGEEQRLKIGKCMAVIAGITRHCIEKGYMDADGQWIDNQAQKR